MVQRTALLAALALLVALWVGSSVVEVVTEVQGKIARVEAALNR